jgi:hypothetical protein
MTESKANQSFHRRDRTASVDEPLQELVGTVKRRRFSLTRGFRLAARTAIRSADVSFEGTIACVSSIREVSKVISRSLCVGEMEALSRNTTNTPREFPCPLTAAYARVFVLFGGIQDNPFLSLNPSTQNHNHKLHSRSISDDEEPVIPGR